MLIRSLLIIAALGLLQAIPCSAADADEITSLAEQNLALVTTSRPDDAVRVRVSETYGKLPLHFEANRGQTDPSVKFFARAPVHTVFLTPTEAVLVLTQPGPREADDRRMQRSELGERELATRSVLHRPGSHGWRGATHAAPRSAPEHGRD